MLRYTEFGFSTAEVPGESSICIYISGCPNKCPDCHYPLLQLPDTGDPLGQYYSDMLDLYDSMASCVCFLGEGDISEESRREIVGYAKVAHKRGLKCCLYSGRDVNIEDWMEIFDYIKIGSYNKVLGPLSSRKTNQRMYRKKQNGYEDITKLFWI